jgi:hypothetical protein
MAGAARTTYIPALLPITHQPHFSDRDLKEGSTHSDLSMGREEVPRVELQHPPGGPPHYRCARRGRAANPLDLVSPWPPPYPSLPPSSSIFISGSRFSLYGEPSTGGGPWRPLRATTRLVLLVAVLCHGRRSDRIMGSQGARGQRRACYQGRGGEKKRPNEQVTIGECLETSSTHKIVTRRSHEGVTCHNINQNSIARLNYREQSHKAKERHLRTGSR